MKEDLEMASKKIAVKAVQKARGQSKTKAVALTKKPSPPTLHKPDDEPKPEPGEEIEPEDVDDDDFDNDDDDDDDEDDEDEDDDSGDEKAPSASEGHRTAVKTPQIKSDALYNTSRLFAAIGSEPRMALLLAIEGGGELRVSELVPITNSTSQPAVSHHLGILKSNNLVRPDRQGKESHYRLTDQGELFVDFIKKFIEM